MLFVGAELVLILFTPLPMAQKEQSYTLVEALCSNGGLIIKLAVRHVGL
jgi:hypothetical protein